MSVHVRSRLRTRALAVLLCVLALLFVVRGILGSLPHEPRLYILNDSLRPIRDRSIHSACGDIALPRLAHGQSIRLDRMPRPGCSYAYGGETLHVDHLLRLLELARDRKSDVEIRIGLDYFDATLTTRHKCW